ncbi:MAG TPA: 50S ribosomal protein L17 [Verrucomicrobiae bacterium]|jgi:large subunit ribosomal protein L17|nr:50S ribosomal protein L17 [Verrucomicrobiae bacterium]
MHRHGYQGRKLHRERDQRSALIKGLADSLIKYESIETTLPKAKEVVPYVEKLITKAKKGDLHNRRQVISDLQTVASAHKLVDEIAPKLKNRSSGHLRIEKTILRRGDNAQLARISFVDDLKEAPVAKPAATTPATPKAAKATAAAPKPKAAAKEKK